MALTFDDGWSPANGRKILAILIREKVTATFFVNSVYLHRDPALWKAIAARYPVGNHTYLHRDVTKLTRDEIVDDLEKNAAVFQKLTAVPMAPLFRPPFGYHTPASDAAAAAAGYPTIVIWSADARDTTRRSDAAMARFAEAATAGGIVLMHMGPDATPRILDDVIHAYRARGFSFVTVPQLLALPR